MSRSRLNNLFKVSRSVGIKLCWVFHEKENPMKLVVTVTVNFGFLVFLVYNLNTVSVCPAAVRYALKTRCLAVEKGLHHVTY